MSRFLGKLSVAAFSLLAILSFIGCQSVVEEELTSDVLSSEETVESPVSDEVSELATITEQNTETPVRVTYSYMGYELTIEAYDGYAVITYPSGVSNEDVEAFLAEEAAEYDVSGVTYSFIGDSMLRLDYPEGISIEERKILSDMLANDLIIYVTPVPVVIPETEITSLYSYNGYQLKATIGKGKTTIVYPDFITDDEVEDFFAFENAKNDFASLGVVYYLEKPGICVLTYPESYSIDVVSSQLDAIVNDLVAYITAVPESVPEADPEAVMIEGLYSYGGYELRAVITPGKVELEYPEEATDEEVEAFIAAENERYGLGDIGVRYTLTGPGRAVFTYPESISPVTVAYELDTLVSDLIAYITPAPKVVSVTMPEPEEKPSEPIVKTYSYAGYTIEAVIGEGRTELAYPAVPDDEAEAFIALENERYGLGEAGVVYTIEEQGRAVFTYPETIDPETVAAELDMLVDDLIAYVTVPETAEEPVEVPDEAEPIVKTYSYDGYTIEAVIGEGRTELAYPAVPDDEAEAFIALENERYGLGDAGVVYTIEEPGRAVFTYPETIYPETVVAELDMLVDDLIEYAM